MINNDVKTRGYKFLDEDIEEKIVLKVDELLYLTDLDGAFAVLSKGKLALAYESIEGTGAALKLFSKKDSLIGGYGAFLEKKDIENFFFIVLEETTLLKLSKERSSELLEDKDFLFTLLETMAKGSFSLIKDLIYRSDKSVEKFLAYVLLKYSEDDKFKVKSFSRFSEYMKCSRSNLYIALGKLEESRIIKKEGKTIIILDKKGLKEVSEV